MTGLRGFIAGDLRLLGPRDVGGIIERGAPLRRGHLDRGDQRPGCGGEALGRLRVTASSHKRASLVEVMGRQSGFLALDAAIAGGAEAVVLPEVPTKPELLADEIRGCYQRGKRHAIVVVAEGATFNADSFAHYFAEHAERLGFQLRVSKLGHIQRGSSPAYSTD